MNAPLFVAHRGESHDAPENTLAAFNLAWERKCKAIELDIRLSRDSKVVVIHDADTMRVSGKKIEIASSTYDQIQDCDAGGLKDEKYRGEKIPLLPQVFESVPEGCRVVVEIKCGAEIYPALKQVIEDSGLDKEQIELICFNVDTLAEAEKYLPEHKRILLAGIDKNEPELVDSLIKTCKEKGFDGLDLCFGNFDPEADKALLKEMAITIKRQGLLLYTWTVDDIEMARLQTEVGVDAITSNVAASISASLNMQ